MLRPNLQFSAVLVPRVTYSFTPQTTTRAKHDSDLAVIAPCQSGHTSSEDAAEGPFFDFGWSRPGTYGTEAP